MRYSIAALTLALIAGLTVSCATNDPGGHDYNNGLFDTDPSTTLTVKHTDPPAAIWGAPDGYRNVMCLDLKNGLYAYVLSGNDYGAGNAYYTDKYPCKG